MRISAFTLIELLVALSLGAILLLIAMPSFRQFLRDTRLATQSDQLFAALNLARSEAAKGVPGRGTLTQVALCKADTTAATLTCDQATCDDTTGSHCWERGWLVFRDPNYNGKANDPDEIDACGTARDCILAIFPPLPPGFTLRTGINIANWIAFEPDGSPRGSNGLANDTFRLCWERDTGNARSIVIRSGRPRLEPGARTCP